MGDTIWISVRTAFAQHSLQVENACFRSLESLEDRLFNSDVKATGSQDKHADNADVRYHPACHLPTCCRQPHDYSAVRTTMHIRAQGAVRERSLSLSAASCDCAAYTYIAVGWHGSACVVYVYPLE